MVGVRYVADIREESPDEDVDNDDDESDNDDEKDDENSGMRIESGQCLFAARSSQDSVTHQTSYAKVSVSCKFS